RRIRNAGQACQSREELTPAQRRLERILLTLRTAHGLSFEELGAPEAEADVSPLIAAARSWARGQDPSLVHYSSAGLRLTEAGFWYSSGLIADLVAALPDAGTPAHRPAGVPGGMAS